MHDPTARYHGVPNSSDPSLGGHDLKNHGRKASEAADADVVASVFGVWPGGHPLFLPVFGMFLDMAGM